jgi:hypothetical protein
MPEFAKLRRPTPELQDRREVTPSRSAPAPPEEGRSLDGAVRTSMEARFGHDFGWVRVHADQKSDAMASAHGALAYTIGFDIFFGSDRYRPDESAGRIVLAHELAHVVQQCGTSPAVLHRGSSVLGDAAERVAEATAAVSGVELCPTAH